MKTDAFERLFFFRDVEISIYRYIDLSKTDDLMELYAESPEGVGENIADCLVQVIVGVLRPFVDPALHEQVAVVA